jgi:uncharacterized protein DUF4384
VRIHLYGSLRLNLLLALFALSIGPGTHPAPQNQDVQTRDLRDSSLLDKRPPGKNKKLPRTQSDAFVGVTVWRLRPSLATDNPAVRSLIHEGQQSSEWTPERIKTDSQLHEGEKVRITIETARSGYLYVIDCDQYEDGSQGEPYLIFPTMSIRHGDNYVVAGTVIELPAAADKPPYFKMIRSRKDQTSELLTIVVTPRMIDHLHVGQQRLLLSREQVTLWISKWKTAWYQLEAEEQVGKPYTLAEKSAAAGETQLTQDDPLPQTVYRLDAKPGEPLLIQLPLRVSE